MEPGTLGNSNNFSGKKMIWIYVAVFVIVAIIVFVAYEIFKTRTVGEPLDPAISALENQSSSDAISDIEKDLIATDLTGLDSGLQDIDASLK
ncbi:MAG: hypothetical protein AAB824_01515 [Patescibacteria group bacterium]